MPLSSDRRRALPLRARWSPAIAAGAMIVVTFLLWSFADRREQDRIRALTLAEADSVTSRIASHLDILAENVERTSLRLTRLDAMTRDVASAESFLLLRDPAIGSVLWLSHDLSLEWAFGPDASPVPGQIEEWMAVTPDPGFSGALERDRTTISRALVGPGGARSFLLNVPLSLRTGPAGLMVVVIDFEEWLRSIVADLGIRHQLGVYPQGLEAAGDEPAPGALRHAASRTIERGDLLLRVLVWPPPATLAALRSPLPRVVLVGGLVFALLLAVAIRLGHVEGQRARDARMAAALEKEIEARRHAEEQLAARNRALERSNEDLMHFARIISHDLREPLNVIDMHLQLLRNAADPEAIERHVAKGRRASARMVRMIDGLLAYSRVGGADRSNEVDTTECARRAVANLESAIQDAGAEVKVGELPVVMGHGGQLTQLFQNLIGNAVHHRGDRAPAIAVRAEVAGEHWLFRVQDDGPGIPAELASRVFELFEGGDRSRGSGVGLATCRRLVESAGGRIWVQSQPGEGSTFLFTWPRNGAQSSSRSSSGAPASR